MNITIKDTTPIHNAITTTEINCRWDDKRGIDFLLDKILFTQYLKNDKN